MNKEQEAQIEPVDVHKEVIDILNLQLENPVSSARLLAIVQEERIAYWKSIGMSEEYMDVNEVWLELTGLLQFCRGIGNVPPNYSELLTTLAISGY